MCYTIKIDLTREELERQFGAKLGSDEVYTPGDRVSAFALPRVPVICNDNTAEIRTLFWGLIPYWVKNTEQAKDIRMKTFNARSESLAEKASYRHLIGHRRCIVLVNGFYEWQTNEKRKIPYLIGMTDKSPFALAGLYDKWKNPETSEIVSTFTIITTRANPLLEVIHNTKKRMPVILSPDQKNQWLDVKTNPAELGIFEPFPQELLRAEQLIY